VTETLLQVDNLAVRFGQTDAVTGVSFSLEDGKTLALVGESGSGKSVTALSILQLLPYPMASHPYGSIKLAGEEIIGIDNDALRSVRGAMVGMIFQEPMTSLNPLHPVGKQISETLIIHGGLSRSDAMQRSLELLDLVKLPDKQNKIKSYPHELSGGQRQRIMIAMALANSPRLLIADEPTTALDVTIQASILSLLQELQQELGMAILMISHDLGLVRSFADDVCVMTKGEIVEAGTTASVFSNPQHSYTRHLIESEPKGRPDIPSDSGPLLLDIQNLKIKYKIGKGWFGRKRDFYAVKDFSLKIPRGQTIGVVGESGSGKTTLGLGLLRLLKAEGRVVFNNAELFALSQKEVRNVRKDVQIVFQDPFGSLSPRMSVKQIVEEGLGVHEPELSAAQREQKISEALYNVGIDPRSMNRYPHEFSGGQRQRISIARALVLNPQFIVLDEPTSALDMSVQAQIVELLRDLQKQLGLTYLFISHDLKVVRAVSHYIVVMKDGDIIEQGDADELFDNPQAQYTRELMKAAFMQ